MLCVLPPSPGASVGRAGRQGVTAVSFGVSVLNGRAGRLCKALPLLTKSLLVTLRNCLPFLCSFSLISTSTHVSILWSVRHRSAARLALQLKEVPERSSPALPSFGGGFTPLPPRFLLLLPSPVACAWEDTGRPQGREGEGRVAVVLSKMPGLGDSWPFCGLPLG